MTDDLLTTFNISAVVRGSVTETSEGGGAAASGNGYSAPSDAAPGQSAREQGGAAADESGRADGEEDPLRYAMARQRGMLRVLPSPSTMISATIIGRIVSNRQQFEAKHKRKAESEAAYYEGDKGYVAEL